MLFFKISTHAGAKSNDYENPGGKSNFTLAKFKKHFKFWTHEKRSYTHIRVVSEVSVVGTYDMDTSTSKKCFMFSRVYCG